MQSLRVLGALIGGIFVACFFAGVCGFIGTIAYTMFVIHNTSLNNIDPSSGFQSVISLSPGTLVGAGIGLLIGLIALMNMVARAFKINRLENTGMRLSAIVTDVRRETHTTRDSNGFSSTSYRYHVTADWVDPRTNQRHTFREVSSSKPIVGPGGYINVLVNPGNFRDYHLEL